MFCVETESLQSNQQMDTRVVLYCMYAQDNSYATARVKTSDTDIFFILLHHADRLTDLQLLLETGKGRTKCCIDITSTEITWHTLLNANLCASERLACSSTCSWSLLLHFVGICK